MATLEPLSALPREQTGIEAALESLQKKAEPTQAISALRYFPARPARTVPFPGWVDPRLAEVYRSKGIEQPYTHQAISAELVRSGKNLVVVTPTASGKTLCYNLPVLHQILEDPGTRALYLFPTKALADSLPGEAARAGRWRLARLVKRQRDYARAARLWAELADDGAGKESLAALEELAICYEHRLRQLDAATAVTRQALTELNRFLMADPEKRRHYQRAEARFAHRLRRLTRKRARLELPLSALPCGSRFPAAGP